MLKVLQPVAARLEAADRSWQKEKGGGLLLRCVPWLLAVVVFAFLLDVFLHLGATHRLVLLVAVLAASLVALGWSWYVARVRRNHLEQIARHLENRDPTLGSRLINLLQLQAQTEDAGLAPLTRQLAQQAVEGYAEQLRGIDFARLAKTGRLKTELKKAAWAGLGFAAVLGIFYNISALEIARFADPFGDHPAYSFTRLEIIEPGAAPATVVFRKSFLVKVKHTGHDPRELFLTFHPPGRPDQAATVPMFNKGGLGFYQEIESITNDLVLFAHTKNHHSQSKQRHLEVLLTPKLDKAFVQVVPPAYTGLKPEEKSFQFKNFRALTNSQVTFRLQSNRPLRGGVIEILKSDTDIERVPMTTSGANEVTGVLAARDSGRLRFSLVDVDGIASQDLWEGSITVTHDLPPEIRITQPDKDSFVSLGFKMEVQIEVGDDYGLKMIRIHRALNQVYSAPKIIPYETLTRNAREVFPLVFADLGLQSGDVISIFAEAIDTAPEANLARSQTVNLTVITEEEYNDFLRERTDLGDIENKYSDLLGQFHNLIEQQKKIGATADELRKKIAAATGKEKEALTRELDTLLARQNELNQKLNKLAGSMEQFVRKNPLYDVEAELQKVLDEKAQAIRESTKANNDAAAEVARQSSPPTGPRQLGAEMPAGLKKASDEQLARLGELEKETAQELVQTLQEMEQMQELLKDFNRFETLHQVQQALAGQARAYNRAGSLSREDQLALKNLASTERQVGEELEELGKKLRTDARAAEKLFPKAAQSAEDLADKMEEMRLRPLARQATDMMLAGNGENSFELSDRLRAEMDKLFSQCNSEGGRPGASELDQYLKLQRQMNPGKNFSQMSQCRKFGKGEGMGLGQGGGQAGTSGYAIMAAPAMNVLGGESAISKSGGGPARSSAAASGQPGGESGQVAFDKPDVVKGVNPVNRPADAVISESIIEEYSDLVEKYFKALTK